jgi:stress-induced morphogen
MTRRSTKTLPDAYVNSVLEILHQDYAQAHAKAKVDVYRQNFASIRIRVIDPDFQGMDRVQRDNLLWKTIEKLPDEIQSQITMLVLLTPKETKTSFANMEFNDPSSLEV